MQLQRMIHAAFGQGAIRVLVDADTTDLNLYTAAGSPTKAVRVVLTIAAGVIVGATSVASYALNVGQFPSGSDITIDNYGQILGAGGAANGGTGGSAINADYPNQSVVIRNHAGANIYAGGGGGGKGGTGGQGGTGGGGYYYSVEGPYYSAAYAWNVTQGSGTTSILWAGSAVYYGGPIDTSYGSYNRGPFVKTTAHQDDIYQPPYYVDEYQVSRSTQVNTNGGAGGAGGVGGNGGHGMGYDGNAVAGLPGAAGVAGANGGTNAGRGGTGGTGGNGGAGGDWGVNGTAGSTGATGAAGFNGNYTSGLAGKAGAGGATGGLAGFYLKKGSANVALINNGNVAGRLE